MSESSTKSNAQVKQEIIEFLDKSCGLVDTEKAEHRCGTVHRNCLVLATSRNDMPRATPLEFFNEGLTLFIFGEAGGKTTNIKHNDNVCAAIYEQPMHHDVVQKSLQIFGKAQLINAKEDASLFKEKARKWNMYSVAEALGKPFMKDLNLQGAEKDEMVDKILTSLIMIKIEPYHVIVREYHPDFSMPKFEWKASDDKQ
jgi:nitroimidazol reductase NimA-like FMN-containing flavoprotein (pyridoxamine 5'-phosphate oxidase superfamily)